MTDTFKQENTEAHARPRIRLTTYGWVLVFLMVWTPLTALFTANNFLLIIFVMSVGMAAVSHTLATRNLRWVSIHRSFPAEMFAGSPFTLRYRLRARQRLWGAVTLRFQESPPLAGERRGIALSRILPDEDLEISALYTVTERGDKRIAPGRIESSFPFGLAVYSKPCGQTESVLVYPRLEKIDHEIPVYLGGFGRGVEKADPFGTVPYVFREYVPGDPYKHIDWKKTAQTGSLITKVLSEEGAREVTIHLPYDASERAISRAASLIVHFAAQGTPVALSGPSLMEGPAGGEELTRSLLAILARWPGGLEAGSAANQGGDVVVHVEKSGDLEWLDCGETYGWNAGRIA